LLCEAGVEGVEGSLHPLTPLEDGPNLKQLFEGDCNGGEEGTEFEAGIQVAHQRA
jgi:hypothetical protein